MKVVSYVVWCRDMGIAWEIGRHLESCNSRMLRYMASVRWQDRISSEEMAVRCGLKMMQDKLRQKRLQWFCHVRREAEGGVLRFVEEMEVSGGEKESRKTKKNLERYSEEGFRSIRSESECGIGSKKIEKDHSKSVPHLKQKYRLPLGAWLIKSS